MPRSAGDPAGTPARTVLVLLNPGAGRSRTLRDAQRRIEEYPNLTLDLIIPDPGDQREQFAQSRAAVEEGVDAVVVCGGDGMVSAGVNLVAQRGVPMGVIPAGSGNDFARAAGIPRRYEAAMHRVLHALAQSQLPLRPVDALRLRRTEGIQEQVRWAANSVNIGFDARVNQRANVQQRTPRQLRYLIALAQEVPRFSPVGFDVEFDGAEPLHLESALICCQNGPTIGGGIPLAPGARIDDGSMNASHVGPLTRAGLVALFPLLMMRMHRWLTPLTTLPVRQLSLHVPAGVPVYADGDEFLTGAVAADQAESEPVRLDIELVPAAVHLLD